MRHLPFPFRVAVGLAVTTAEWAKGLPRQVIELPVTVASQVLQVSMRVQQHVTELAIKGDNALSGFSRAEEEPSWATFDEDLEPSEAGSDATPVGDTTFEPSEAGGAPSGEATGTVRAGGEDPWAEEERALGEEHREGEFDMPVGATPTGIVTTPPLTDYDNLTLPQVRGRLRRLSLTQLEELLAYEQDHGNRPAFVGMLTRRIANVRREADDGRSPGTNSTDPASEDTTTR